MILILGSALAMAIAPQPAISHSVSVAHNGAPITATYSADVVVQTRQVGLSAGARPSTQRCVWTADVGVERAISRETGATVTRRLADTQTLSGSRHGSCATTAAQIERDVAAATDGIRQFVVEAATRDEQTLRAELAALTQLAAN